MKMRAALWIAAGMAVLAPASAPAGPKPCRDAAGKLVACEKARKATARCKDAKGRFAPCPAAAGDAEATVPAAAHGGDAGATARRGKDHIRP